MRIAELLDNAAGRFGSCEALHDATCSLSFEQYVVKIKKVAAELQEIGVNDSSRVALIANNSISYAIVALAILYAGATAVLLPARYPSKTIMGMLKNVGVDYILFDSNEETKQKLDQISNNSQILSLNDYGLNCVTNSEKDINNYSNSTEPATIVFSSGSSGQPKAIQLGIANHYYNAIGANDNIRFNPGDRWLMSLPLYHVGGLAILFRSLIGGGSVLFPSSSNTLTQIDSNNNISHLSLVPTQLRKLIDGNKVGNNRSYKFKALLVGGGAVPKGMIEEAISLGWPIYTTYGLTEAASQVATSIEPIKNHNSSSVKILAHRDVRISDKSEIEIRGPILFEGYIENQKLIKPFDSAGWFATGDLGHIDNDGMLYVKGRKDNMIISGGENIHPEAIEAAIYECCDIEEVIVVGVHSEKYEQRPVAFVKFKNENNIVQNELRTRLEKLLPSFMIPDKIYEWPDDCIDNMKQSRQHLAAIAQDRNNH